MRRIASYLTNKIGFSDQFTAAAVGQTILGQPPGSLTENSHSDTIQPQQGYNSTNVTTTQVQRSSSGV